MNERVKGVLRHRMPGRLRITLAHPLPDRDSLEALAGMLASAGGVEEIEIRPRSGSIIVRHCGDHEEVAEALREAGLEIEIPPSGPVDPIQVTLQRIARADAAVQRLSGGRADLLGVSFSLLVLTGLVQVGRGNIAGPALAVFGQAATLARARLP